MHPEPRLNPVEVRTGAGTTGVGALEYSASFIRTIAAANRSLAALEGEGAFVREQQVEYEVVSHFYPVAEWQAYLEAEAAYYVPPDEAMLGSINAALDQAPGDIALGEWIRATRYRRAG